MSRPLGFRDLAGRTVGIFGVGVEGRAAARALDIVGASVVLVDDHPAEESGVLATNEGGFEALSRCDIVLKSPGIPRRRSDVVALESQVHLTSALEVWLAGTDRGRVIGVTGTKGKSTTASLIDFCLRACGASSRLTGNIGVPPYDPAAPDSDWTVLEISSYQAVDIIEAPGLVVVTSLGADHLDWHGSLDQYHEDKLSITHAEGHHLTVIPDDPELVARRERLGGDLVIAEGVDRELCNELGLVGEHNARNVALAVRVTALALHIGVDEVRSAASRDALTFTPLPGRLTLVHRSGVLDFIDDGLATTPLATSAALDSLSGREVVAIVGGFDRGVDYDSLFESANRHGEVTLVATGPAGARIAREAPSNVRVIVAENFADAVATAVSELSGRSGVVLLSPAAPSFDEFANWSERSAAFTAAAMRY